jgi:hypothetical protein
MAASKRSRRAQAPINVLFCAALFVASFVVYWMGISAYEQRLRPSGTEGVNAVQVTVPSEFRSTVDSYATSESANIEHPADHGGTNHFWDAIASFFGYWTGPGIGFDGPPSSTEHPAVTSHALDGTPPHFSTLDSYAAPGSAYIEHPAVQGRTSYASDGTLPRFSTLGSYSTPGFKGIFEEEGKRAGEITKAKKEATQTQAAPPRVREAPPKAISPPDAELTLADASGADLSDLSVPAFQRPAVPGPAVRVPALQGPAFPVPAFRGPAFPVPAYQGPAFK